MDGIAPYPQLLLNVRVREKPDLQAAPGGRAGGRPRSNRRCEGSGRVVLRYSGTEPLARVMIEGKDERGGARSTRERWPT